MFLVAFLALQATTTCQTYGNTTTCEHEAPSAYSDPFKAGQQAVAPAAPSTSDDWLVRALKGDLNKKVGKLLSKGDCEGAERAALKGGDIDLATRVKAYCAK